MTRSIPLHQVIVYEIAAGDGKARGPRTLEYAGVVEANAMDFDRLTLEIHPRLPDLWTFPHNVTADIYPFIEFDLTPAGARELAMDLLSGADRADRIGLLAKSTRAPGRPD
jgi:hypothetical protein